RHLDEVLEVILGHGIGSEVAVHRFHEDAAVVVATAFVFGFGAGDEGLEVLSELRDFRLARGLRGLNLGVVRRRPNASRADLREPGFLSGLAGDDLLLPLRAYGRAGLFFVAGLEREINLLRQRWFPGLDVPDPLDFLFLFGGLGHQARRRTLDRDL